METVSSAAYGGSLVLAGIAGFVDAVGFILSGGLFVSFMSGNSTQAGVELVDGQLATAASALGLVISFVCGVTLGHLLTIRCPGLMLGTRILALALALGLATVSAALIPIVGFSLLPLAAVMGAMNTLFVADGRARVALTYATGTLVTFGVGLAERANGSRDSAWARPLCLWASISIGAIVGAIGWRVGGVAILAVPTSLLGILGVLQILRAQRLRRISR